MQTINTHQESKNITDWIRKVFTNSAMEKIVIGMSGGIDSSVSCALVTQAIGKENVIPVLLPYGALSSQGIEDARLVIDYLEIPEEQVKVIDIQKGVDGITPPNLPLSGEKKIASLLDKEGLGRVRMGNIMARVRMIYLFDMAKQYKGLVCGTENKSEHYLGYFTRFGDEASDIEPIRHLYKTDVWEIGRQLDLPQKIITKAPTAGLWDGQTDESELGFTYQAADKVLQYYIDEKLSEGEIIKKGIEQKIVKKVVQRVKENEFKHKLPFVYC